MAWDSETPSLSKPLLWLTVTHPGQRRAGNQAYSGGLLEALTAVGQPVTLLTQDTGPSMPLLSVTAVPSPNFRPKILGLLGRYPAGAWQLGHRSIRRALNDLLHKQRWRAVVIDQAASGWAATQLASVDLPMVYIAHNHEASVRRQVALAEPSRPRRWLMQADAAKYARLEQILVGKAALVTAITDNDARTFAETKPIASILTLPPGYNGRVLQHRVLTPATPRKVVLVGKFEWVAKQLNLTRWAHEAVPLLNALGIETQVVGTVPSALQARLARPGLSFAGPVAEIQPYLCDARFGLVAEDVGGGFKLKTLDYLFHRLPIAALDGNLAGLPEAIIANTMVADTPRALAGSIIARIDDLEQLNQMQHNAFRAAQTAFDWEERARRFLHALDRLDQNV